MFESEISRSKKVILFTLLIVLNIVLRIPSIPHEKGADSFFIHSLSNSITTYGCANWWLNWLSVFGLYPYSYASAIPFSLSGFSQLTGLTGLEMEKAILIFSVTMGLFSIFTAYTLAGAIYNDFIYKYLTAFFFSISQGVMMFSTWEVSTRGPFIIYLPFFIFALIKKVKLWKSVLLLITLTIFLAAVHHYFYFSLILLFIFITLRLLSRVNLTILKSNLTFDKESYFNYLYIILLMASFMYPFFSRTLIEAGSRYEWILIAVIINVRQIGPILIFFCGGLIYLIFKRYKRFEEIYILSALVVLIPTMYSHAYGVYILLVFIILFVALGFRNLVTAYENQKFKKTFVILAILIMIVSSAFSGFYNHARTGNSQNYWYMPEITYCAAKWTNSYIPEYAHGFAFGGETWRLFSTSDAHPIVPTLSAEILTYGLMNESDIQMNKNSPSSLDYYFEGPYVPKPNTDISGFINWFTSLENIDGKQAREIINRFNATYVLEDIYSPEPIMSSIQTKKNNIFNNGRIRIWTI